MKRIFPLFAFLILISAMNFSINSCSSSSGIDDFYTFNVDKSPTFTISSQVPVEQNVTTPITIVIDSADFVTSSTLSTNISQIQSVKLTKLSFSSSDPSYLMTNLDTLDLIVSADSLNDQLLASYSGTNDMVTYTNADFAMYFKKPSVHYSISYRANKAPSQDINISAQTNLVFSAAPLQ